MHDIWAALADHRAANRDLSIAGLCADPARAAAFAIPACGMVLDALEKQSRKLVERANQQEGLALNTRYLLGLPGHQYFAFDAQHRKIAVCNLAADKYSIHDFSLIRRWYVDNDTIVRGEIGMGGAPIPGTPMQGPSLGTRTQERGFRLVLEVNDVARPIVNIPMRNSAEAEQWSARLGAFLNG